MATISNTPRPGYVWDSTDNVWYPIGVGAHQHTNAADTPAVMPYSTYAAAGKNKIINGDFAINQRAFTSSTTANTFGFDRWFVYNSDGTVTHSAQTFTPGTAPVSGYEGINYVQVVTSGQTLASAEADLIQKIENVRTLAGQTATISFWAKAASGTPKIGVELYQVTNGTGGGSIPAGTVTISTSWARYSVTVSVPSLTGATIAAGNALQLTLFLSAGSSVPRASGIGIQSNTFQIWGVQVEASSTATAFQTATGNPASELAACQRYYQAFPSATQDGYALFGSGYSASTTKGYFCLKLNSPMRTSPTMSYSAGNTFAVHTGVATVVAGTAIATDRTTAETVWFNITVASGLTAGNGVLGIGNNTTSAKMEASAEL